MVDEEIVKLGISNVRMRNNQSQRNNVAPSIYTEQGISRNGFWFFSKN